MAVPPRLVEDAAVVVDREPQPAVGRVVGHATGFAVSTSGVMVVFMPTRAGDNGGARARLARM
jgi:hypothetical protein